MLGQSRTRAVYAASQQGRASMLTQLALPCVHTHTRVSMHIQRERERGTDRDRDRDRDRDTYNSINVYTYTHNTLYTYIILCVCMYMYVCACVYTLSHTHTHTHTQIETQTQRPPLRRNKEFGMLFQKQSLECSRLVVQLWLPYSLENLLEYIAIRLVVALSVTGFSPLDKRTGRQKPLQMALQKPPPPLGCQWRV